MVALPDPEDEPVGGDGGELVGLCVEPPGVGVRPAWVARRLSDAIMARPGWGLHRQVHLVNAFADVSARTQVDRVLSVGSGRGLAELFLAVCHPAVEFTLTDFDPGRLRHARWRARALGITNVRFEVLDLLATPPARGRGRFDLAIGVEVLEHIDQDQLALANVGALTRGYLYQLVPFCDEADLTDERICTRAWSRFGHYRPGYTRRTLEELLAGTPIEWARTCYYAPQAPALRQEVAEASRRDRRRRRQELVTRAVADVRDEPADGRQASGIEVLARCS